MDKGHMYVITVHERRVTFVTLADARQAAADYYRRTGCIVGIVEE